MIVNLKNDAGMTRQVKIGFSWTAFFFRGFVFFFRGMIGHGVLWLALTMITMGLSNFVLIFIINKQTAQYYVEKLGYNPVGEGWELAGPKWGISAPSSSSSPATT